VEADGSPRDHPRRAVEALDSTVVEPGAYVREDSVSVSLNRVCDVREWR
jgi:hypothetical protein